jgi:ParB-like chromosome segregation protein Spo0J
MSVYQFLPSLNLDEYEALRESIRKYGVIQPVIVDESGVVIDGYHRAKVCKELGIDYPTRVIEGLSEEEKENLSVSLNIKRRHLTKDQKKELALALREQGWTQERIAEVMEVGQQTISNWLKSTKIGTPDQRSQNLNQDELLTLKLRVEEAEKKAETLNSEIDAKVKAQTDATKAEYQRRFDEAVAKAKAQQKLDAADQSVIDKLVEQRTAEKVAELERARLETEASRLRYDKDRGKLEQARQRDKKYLQEELEKKSKEIDDAAQKHLDLKKLQQEYDLLKDKKIHLEAEIEVEKFNDKVRRRIRGAHEAFVQASTVMQIIGRDITTRDDCCGLSVEELEQFERETAQIGVMVNEIIPAIHELIARIRTGGGLRIVKGL